MNKEDLSLIHEAARVSGWYKRPDANVLKKAYKAITDALTAEIVEEALEPKEEVKPVKKTPTKKKGK